ncbi:MAG TPA: hypothetical protein VI688_03880 [Anaerolineales bacterium]|nr:hypothetical protein [Anaerolineales bacterium]
MLKVKSLLRSEPLLSLLLILVAAGAAYMLHLGQVGYTNDDWYLMYAAKTGGPGYFNSIFSFDRPLRALVLAPAYGLFGDSPLLYNLSALGLRLLSTLFLLWTLRLLWPRQRKATLAMALLFLLYPGFLSQLNGIDYLPVMLSLAAATLSLGLSTLAFFETRPPWRWLWMGSAVVLGLFYVGLVEYEAAFEFMRLGIFFVLFSRKNGSFRKRLAHTLRTWVPYSLIPLVFIVWNLFLFESQRQATSLGSQFSFLLYSPVQTSLTWLSNWLMSAVNVFIAPWAVPLYQLSSRLQPAVLLAGFALGGLIAALTLRLASYFPAETSPPKKQDWRCEALWLGLALALVGTIPVVLANRQIVFPGLSRYTLVSSVGVAIFAAACLQLITATRLRRVLFASLLVVSVATHFANGAIRAQETASIRSFWWQVSWRVPQFEVGTTLVAHYPIASVEESYFVWAPANLIYYPYNTHAGQENSYLQPGIYAAISDDETVRKVLIGVRQEYENRRTIRTYANYRNILILTQPAPGSCVQVIDGKRPELSAYEAADFIAMASYSEIEAVQTESEFHQPPEPVFGAEPERGWCYLYEKASLARQQGDWERVIQLGEQAFSAGLNPADAIEWMPFLQAYALAGQFERVADISDQIGELAFVRAQACSILTAIPGLTQAAQEQIQPLFCSEE